jgi:hypothetical protein
MPLGTEKASLLGAAAGGLKQYFGDGSDGALDTTGSVDLTVLNASGYDGDMVLAQYTTLDINSGHTLSVDDQCRGLFIYVVGNCTIAGTLSMANKGCSCNPTTSGGSDSQAVSSTGLRLPMLTSGGSDTLEAADFAGCGNAVIAAVENQKGISGDGTIFKVAQVGSTGGSGANQGSAGQHQRQSAGGGTGNAGTTGGATISTAGGGGGGASGRYCNAVAYNGGTGGAFSGGGGAQGTGCHGDAPGGPQCGSSGINGSYGATGPNASCCGNQNQFNAGGGSGQTGGNKCGAGGSNGSGGVGGLIWLVVGGDLTITGTVTCASSGNGGSGNAPGGGTGGGAAMILYAGTLSNSGTFSFGGGSGSGAGGTGGYHIAQVSAA